MHNYMYILPVYIGLVMGYSFVRVTPLAGAVVHFLLLFHIVSIAVITAMSKITKTTQPTMAPPTAAGTDTLLPAALSLLFVVVVVVISQAEGVVTLSQAEMTVASGISTDRNSRQYSYR